MNALRYIWQRPLLLLLLALAVGAAGGYLYNRPTDPAPTMSKAAQRRAIQEAAAAQVAAAKLGARADTTAWRAETPYAVGKAAEAEALTFHAQSHAPTHRPSSSPAAVDSLTRFFANY